MTTRFNPTPRFGWNALDPTDTFLTQDSVFFGAWGCNLAACVPASRTWAYYGGAVASPGTNVISYVVGGTIVCTDDATVIVQRNSAGTVTIGASLTVGNVPMAKVTCASGAMTHFEDIRDAALLARLPRMLYGTNTPSSGTGEDGDFFFDGLHTTWYGPKASGAWPSGIPLVAPPGAGTQGAISGEVAVFGSGAADGALALLQTDSAPSYATKSGTGTAVIFSLTRDVYATTLHLNAGSGTYQLHTAAWRIFCSVSLTIDAGIVVQNDGKDASGSTQGGSADSNGTLLQSSTNAGTAGTTGAAPASSGNQTHSAATRSTTAVASGGAGGGYSAGTGNGSTAGTMLAALTDGSLDNIQQAIGWRRLGSGNGFDSGSGGSGGPALSGSGGGGGGGGGQLFIAAAALLNSGTIRCKGGNGANGVSGTSSAGGGGGGGGVIVLIYLAAASSVGTVSVAGGTGGTPIGTYGNGAAGAAGLIYTYAL